jgi:hypothetical protein
MFSLSFINIVITVEQNILKEIELKDKDIFTLILEKCLKYSHL